MWTPTDQFIGLTGLTGTWEKSCNAVNTSRSIAAPWCLLVTITCIFFFFFFFFFLVGPPPCATAVAAPSRMQSRMARRRKLYKADLFVNTLKAWRGREGQNAGSSFFFFSNPSFSAVYTPDRGWSLSSLCGLDSCHHKWPRSPSSLMPVDSRVAAGQPIMKWPWSGVSRAMELLKH